MIDLAEWAARYATLEAQLAESPTADHPGEAIRDAVFDARNAVEAAFEKAGVSFSTTDGSTALTGLLFKIAFEARFGSI